MGQSIKDAFTDPELEHTDESEISAFVDFTVVGTDSIKRPINIIQDDQIIALTNEDAKRLLLFLSKAVEYVEEFDTNIIQ